MLNRPAKSGRGMTEMQLDAISAADVVGPVGFLLCWLGYTLFADREHQRPSLQRSMEAYRRVWMRRMLERENRMVDAQIIGNLMRSASFFASTTVLIIAGLIAVLGAKPTAMAVLAELPFAVETSSLLWDFKVFLLIVAYVYAFFKFTWAFRQYNYCLILLGSVPLPNEVTDESRRIAERSARIASLSARHFNRGTRAYYFGLAGLSWFIHPWLLIGAGAWVVLVLYRREFHSRLSRVLSMPAEEPAPR
jgi:uncharacterized membrane protein